MSSEIIGSTILVKNGIFKLLFNDTLAIANNYQTFSHYNKKFPIHYIAFIDFPIAQVIGKSIQTKNFKYFKSLVSTNQIFLYLSLPWILRYQIFQIFNTSSFKAPLVSTPEIYSFIKRTKKSQKAPKKTLLAFGKIPPIYIFTPKIYCSYLCDIIKRP